MTVFRSCPASISALFSLAIAVGLSAQPAGENLVRVGAEASVQTIHPGDTFLLAFEFSIEPGWHIYWANPGETGSPTEIEIMAPDGFEVGEIVWPRPLVIPGSLESIGYEEHTTLFVPVTAPEGLEPGTATFSAACAWLVCKEMCYVGDASLTINVQTTDAPRRDASDGAPIVDSSRIEKAMRAVPAPIGETTATAIMLEGDRIHLAGPAHGQSELRLISNDSPGVKTAVSSAQIENGQFVIELEVSFERSNALGQEPVARGVVLLGHRPDDPAYRFEMPLEFE